MFTTNKKNNSSFLWSLLRPGGKGEGNHLVSRIVMTLIRTLKFKKIKSDSIETRSSTNSNRGSGVGGTGGGSLKNYSNGGMFGGSCFTETDYRNKNRIFNIIQGGDLGGGGTAGGGSGHGG